MSCRTNYKLKKKWYAVQEEHAQFGESIYSFHLILYYLFFTCSFFLVRIGTTRRATSGEDREQQRTVTTRRKYRAEAGCWKWGITLRKKNYEDDKSTRRAQHTMITFSMLVVVVLSKKVKSNLIKALITTISILTRVF